MCEKHTAQNFIFILLLEFQFFYRFFAMGVFIVFYSAERDLNNGFNLADSAFPNLRPDVVSSDSGNILIYYHHV